MSVIILSVTNEEGETGIFFFFLKTSKNNCKSDPQFLKIQHKSTVKLPGGGIDVNPESQKQYSISNYIPHIPLLEIPELEFPPCDT